MVSVSSTAATARSTIARALHTASCLTATLLAVSNRCFVCHFPTVLPKLFLVHVLSFFFVFSSFFSYFSCFPSCSLCCSCFCCCFCSFVCSLLFLAFLLILVLSRFLTFLSFFVLRVLKFFVVCCSRSCPSFNAVFFVRPAACGAWSSMAGCCASGSMPYRTVPYRARAGPGLLWSSLCRLPFRRWWSFAGRTRSSRPPSRARAGRQTSTCTSR